MTSRPSQNGGLPAGGESPSSTGDYDAFLERKVALARDERDRGLGRPNDDVEAAFAARRAARVTLLNDGFSVPGQRRT